MLEEYNHKLYNKFMRTFAESLRNSDDVCMLFDIVLYEFFTEAIKNSSYNSIDNDYERFHIFRDAMHKFYKFVEERASAIDDDVIF